LLCVKHSNVTAPSEVAILCDLVTLGIRLAKGERVLEAELEPGLKVKATRAVSQLLAATITPDSAPGPTTPQPKPQSTKRKRKSQLAKPAPGFIKANSLAKIQTVLAQQPQQRQLQGDLDRRARLHGAEWQELRQQQQQLQVDLQERLEAVRQFNNSGCETPSEFLNLLDNLTLSFMEGYKNFASKQQKKLIALC
jgi:hypothetical protein